MSPLWQKVKEVVLRIAARATSGPGLLSNAIKTATLSVAHVLAQMLNMGIAADLRQLKDDGLRRSKAMTDAEEATARELMARAVEAENKANLVKRNDRISKAEEMQKLAEAAKTSAEAKATLIRAEAEQAKVKAEAFVKLLEAISKLKEKGGSLAVDPKNLAQMLGLRDLSDLGDRPQALPAPHPSNASKPPEPTGSSGRPRRKKPKK